MSSEYGRANNRVPGAACAVPLSSTLMSVSGATGRSSVKAHAWMGPAGSGLGLGGCVGGGFATMSSKSSVTSCGFRT